MHPHPRSHRRGFRARSRRAVVAGVATLVAPLALAGCSTAPPPVNGAYRSADGGLLLVGRIDGETLSVADVGTGAALRLRQDGDTYEVTVRGAAAPSGKARFERAADGAPAALWLDGRRAERLPLPERPVEVVAADGTRLAARLILPLGAGPHPAVVYVHGSGFQSAIETFPYGYLLAANGVATLVYDKRGTGASGGEPTFDFQRLARDVVAAVEALAAQPDVDRAHVGLVGYSQGGWVAPLAATLTPVAFVVVNYGMIESPAEEERQETLWRLRERGLTPAELAEADVLIRASLPLLASDFESGWEAWEAAADRFRGRPWTRRLEETTIGALLQYPPWLVRILGPRKAPPELPWSYDGRAALRATDTPMVWLLGAEDRSAPNAMTLRILEQLQREGRRHAVFLFAGADHGIVLFRREGGERVATGFHPDYLRLEARVVRELAAGRWPPAGAGVVPLPPGQP